MFDSFDGKPRQQRSVAPVLISIVGHVVLVGLVSGLLFVIGLVLVVNLIV